MWVRSEIQYFTDKDENGFYNKLVHSDTDGDINDPEYREFAHKLLDEWLNNSNGTEGIYFGKCALLSDLEE